MPLTGFKWAINWEVPYQYVDIQFYDTEIGYLLEDHGELYHTMDGGLSWQHTDQNPGINGLLFHQNYLYGYGKFGKIQRIPVNWAQWDNRSFSFMSRLTLSNTSSK